jgi:hypothetical protein
MGGPIAIAKGADLRNRIIVIVTMIIKETMNTKSILPNFTLLINLTTNNRILFVKY